MRATTENRVQRQEDHWLDDASLRLWVDGELKKRWGALAAARTYLICQTGFDGVFIDPFDKRVPSQKAMKKTERVSGAPPKAENTYAVGQALAWIARQRLDLQEQTQYMREIPQLMQAMRSQSGATGVFQD